MGQPFTSLTNIGFNILHLYDYSNSNLHFGSDEACNLQIN